MSGMPVAGTWNALTHDNSRIKLEIVRLVFTTTRSSFRLKEFNELLSSGNNEGQPEYSPPPDDRPTLVVEGGPNAGVTVTLTASHTTLGRHADNDVVFDEALVSRRHAIIIETGSGFFIRDLESTNGTFLNDSRIAPGEQSIKNGDIIRLGGGAITARFTEGGGRTLRLSTVEPPPADVIVEAKARQVYVKGDRLEPPLTRKQFDLIMLLESRRGEAVSRDEIASSVWPERDDGDVGNHEIEQSVRRVRVRIEDDASSPQYLVTVRGYGYRLN
jgi:pSer/pThr/pTyr-binding forkhead associated (FHA) protein